VYSFPAEETRCKYLDSLLKENNPPSERYIDIIVRGCKYYGVAQSHIDHLEAHPIVPRKKPSEFSKYPVPLENPRSITEAELATMNGLDGAPLCFVVNGKVLNCTAEGAIRDVYMLGAGKDCTQNPPFNPVSLLHRSFDPQPNLVINPRCMSCFSYLYLYPSVFQGTLMFSNMLYEPMYPVVVSRAEMSEEHCAWVTPQISILISTQTWKSMRFSFLSCYFLTCFHTWFDSSCFLLHRWRILCATPQPPSRSASVI
jgi:hypothetical protein